MSGGFRAVNIRKRLSQQAATLDVGQLIQLGLELSDGCRPIYLRHLCFGRFLLHEER